MKNKPYKLLTLAKIEGTTVDEMIELAVYDSVSPGICINESCNYTTEIEPDSREGWCEECETGSVWNTLELGLF